MLQKRVVSRCAPWVSRFCSGTGGRDPARIYTAGRPGRCSQSFDFATCQGNSVGDISGVGLYLGGNPAGSQYGLAGQFLYCHTLLWSLFTGTPAFPALVGERFARCQ